MRVSTANRRSPSSQDGPHSFSQDGPQSFPFNRGGGSSMASYKNPSKVSLPWCSASHKVARGDSSLFRDSPCLPRSASGAAAHGDSSVFSSTANCKLSTARPERSQRVNCFAHFAPRYLVPFHTNTNCPICKSFVLITMQIAGGVGVSPGGARVKASIDEDASPERAQRSEGSLRFPAAPWDSPARLLLSAVSCQLLTRLSSLECAVPRFRLLSPLECAVAKTRCRNSFRMRSYKKSGGGGG